MAITEILHSPHPLLRQVATPVATFDKSIHELADSLIQTLTDTSGIGLCAPQIGVSKRVLVTHIDPAQSSPRIYINPQITRSASPGLVQESCLSLPGAQGTVKRAMQIEVKAQTVSGEPFTETLQGMAAVCLQHETDHLQGILFVDRLIWFSEWRMRCFPSTRDWWRKHTADVTATEASVPTSTS